MNLKTTGILLLLALGGGLGWAVFSYFQASAATNQPPEILDAEIKNALAGARSKQPTWIVLESRGQSVRLGRAAGKTDWTMPGNWPTREDEVKGLVRLLTGLQSRFVAIPFTSKTEEDFGLDRPAVTVTVKVGRMRQVLAFGQPPAGAAVTTPDEELEGPDNRFYQPTYLRVDAGKEAIRLQPGLVDRLRRPRQFYQRPWLFLPPEYHIQGDPSPHTGPSQAVKAISVSEKTADKAGGYTLTWSGKDWELSSPVHDRVDPDRLKTVLSAVPDVWAERFVDERNKTLADYGLKDPEQTLSLTRANGDRVTVLIGKQSRVTERMVMRQLPPIQGRQMPPRPVPVREEYRYAKLAGDDDASRQIFEVKADKLKDVMVPADTLRDPRLARFRTEDAQRVAITWAGHDIVLAKKKGDWRLVKPTDQEAELTRVNELLDKLSGLEARDADVIDKGDLKEYGLAGKPAGKIRVTVEEESKGGKDEKKAKTTKVITFDLGKHDKEKSKLYVRVEPWRRVNAVEDSLFNLVKRPALAYRNRRVLNFSSIDLAKIEVQRPGDPFTLTQAKDTWRLTAPVQADVDAVKVNQLAGDLGNVEAVEFVAENVKPDALDRTYDLGKPALSARVVFSDKKKPAQTLLLGQQRPGKPEYFARLASAKDVFTVKKEVHDALDRGSLTYRPVQLWDMKPEDLASLRVQKEGPEYRLQRDGEKWHISGPFDAAAAAELVRPMTEELARPKCARFAAHFAKSLADYGLDKPYLRLVLTPAAGKDEGKDAKKDDKKKTKKEDKKPAREKEHILLVGKPEKKGGKERFAKLGDSEAIFVLGEKTLAAIDHAAVDLLDRKLLALDTKEVKGFRTTGGARGPLAVEREGDQWRVVEPQATAFTADAEAIDTFLGLWANLQAERFAAYGVKLDLAEYGLKAPAVTVTVTVQPPGEKGKPPARPVTHTLLLGKPVAGKSGQRYARLDQGPAVAILDAPTVRLLRQTYLDFVNRTALKFDAATATALERRMDGATLEVAKRDGAWQIVKPAASRADRQALDDLVAQLALLRAKRVAAFPVKNLKTFGLDKPAAVVTVRLTAAGKKPVEHVLKVGKADGKGAARDNGDRFAQVGDSNAVIVLPGALARTLLAAPLQFRDRNLPGVGEADRVVLERGPRKAVFVKTDGTWKMTEPLEAEAEQTDLDNFLKALVKPRADELVADKPANLKAYGLDRPQVRWRFFNGDKEVLTLLVGDREKGAAGRRYAKVGGTPLVFLLDSGLTNMVLGEYRSRSLGTTLDAAQAETVRYGYDRNPFTLIKVGDDWRLSGAPGAKIKAETVRDTLDALAGLKAARYVVDRGADLKRYGLQPPQLVLEAGSRTGKQVLHVGRREGGTKGYYARVVADNRTDVFVIAEADAKRILRSRKDFMQGSGK
jgi:hypothetical protein